MAYQEELTDYLQAVVNGLISQHVTKAVISPGSRSTPLALLLYHSAVIDTFIGVDERSSAFLGLGLSKASGQPVALLCTSGTAAANYFPAICEANASQVPLIVLTTDRPHELRDVGAPQAMNQTALFGEHTKKFIDMSLPDNQEEMLDYAFWQTARLTNIAQQVPKGPVQLNFPLREPLLPDLNRTPVKMSEMLVLAGNKKISQTNLALLADKLSAKKGVIIIGGEQSLAEARHLIALADKLQWPIIGDPLTNITTCGAVSPNIMGHADLFVDIVTHERPDCILRFGKLPISKNVMLWLKELTFTEIPIYLVDESGEWQDPLKRSCLIIQADASQIVEELQQSQIKPSPDSWSETWQTWQQRTAELIHQHPVLLSLSETAVALKVHQTMASSGQLFVSNSMAIRYLDRFGGVTETEHTVYGNRGVNGIDGIVSTAMGMAMVKPESDNVLLIGDLAMYHDMNGLMWARDHRLSLTIVLLNNNGGGIFSYLSQKALEPEEFEPLFGTPTNLDGKKMAELYGAEYANPKSLAELEELLTSGKNAAGLRIIEVTTSRTESITEYEAIKNSIREAF
ncbi:2-succinyl-5-enolpyruvyl-6-hydroxy-3-cyclohexene-1-carboxylic-acid synthase [Vagococcus vulneris]|uniref:2-succinyl-5-enolpyruvyl-6-hydroxy-3-cyclohexene-1-carboxylate synthase n=1 Tax=Vagococcus vulneris TaxID=1977869 RepID=A0A429ZYA5_9ENTE|nr:2-succinyl-5-enolpyruvyl-6-hydroxy-3-cyclohexene-1-carboxylic-acid synthase [Vagococcus vulneris]RST98917.1 2-succinyl-5-enolpyruvyl-6-hydroxy-3-cyclohexene-1-carboxylic-acid synthase [Vagococcus vulneris]